MPRTANPPTATRRDLRQTTAQSPADRSSGSTGVKTARRRKRASARDDAADEQRKMLLRDTLRLLETEIAFISNRSFHGDPVWEMNFPDAGNTRSPNCGDLQAESAFEATSDVLEGTRPRSAEPTAVGKLPPGLPAHLARLCDADLLTADVERELFRRMNFLKFRANALRSQLDPERPDAELIQSIKRHLAEVVAIRDQLIRSNMRLVIAIVKKFVTPQNSFDDLLSDGIMSLWQAVEKFDYARGFRFSTYAYRAIARNAYRAIMDQRKAAQRFVMAAAEQVEELVDEGTTASLDDATWDRQRESLTGMLHHLDRRERFIIRSRYALGSHRQVRTFQYLADKLGLSKERVRQLEQRAVAKLQAMSEGVRE